MSGAAVYVRVSTKEQAASLSLSSQETACRAWCKRQGLEVIRVFTDAGESAKTADRPAFSEAIAWCREAKPSHLVVYKVDRFARNALDHLSTRHTLEAVGVQLASATEQIEETAAGRLSETLFAAIAEFDNRTRAERTEAGMREALERGRWQWQPPLGYRMVAGRLEIDLDKGPILGKLFRLVAEGVSLAEVVREARRVDLRGARGGRLSSQTLGAALRNPLYYGRVVVKRWGIDVEGRHQSLVDRGTFERVQRVLDGRAPIISKRKAKNPDFPLRRFARCDACSHPLTGSFSRGRSGRYGYYYCHSCRAISERRHRLHGAFVDLLARIKPSSEMLGLMRIALERELEAQLGEDAQAASRARRQLADIETKARRLDDALLDGAIEGETFGRLRSRLQQERREAQATVALAAGRPALDLDGLFEFAESALCEAPDFWTSATPQVRDRFQNVMFPAGISVMRTGSIRTAVSPFIFNDLQGPGGQKSGLVSPTGDYSNLMLASVAGPWVGLEALRLMQGASDERCHRP